MRDSDFRSSRLLFAAALLLATLICFRPVGGADAAPVYPNPTTEAQMAVNVLTKTINAVQARKEIKQKAQNLSERLPNLPLPRRRQARKRLAKLEERLGDLTHAVNAFKAQSLVSVRKALVEGRREETLSPAAQRGIQKVMKKYRDTRRLPPQTLNHLLTLLGGSLPDRKKKPPPGYVSGVPAPAPTVTTAAQDREPPRIEITEPAAARGLTRTVKSKRIAVRGIAHDPSGVAEVLVNGVEAALNADGAFSTTLLLKVGSNRVTVSALDTRNNRGETAFTIDRKALLAAPEAAAPSQEKGLGAWYRKQYLLVVGIDRYANPAIPQLKNAEADARALAGMFRTMGFEVEELYNANASRRNILARLEKIQKKAGPEDSFLFYFAGHGQGLTLATGEKTGYIIPADARLDLATRSVFTFDDQAIALERIHKIAKTMQPRHTALLLDSCFSGIVMKRSLPPAAAMSRDYYRDLLARRAINVLTAGDDQPVSDGSGHSPFTRALLKGLGERGADLHDRDGIVTFGQLAAYVKEKVEKATGRRQRPQFDNFLDDDGDFLFQVR